MQDILRYPANAVFRIVEPILWITPVYFLSKAFQINGENIGFSQYSGTRLYGLLVIGSIVSSFVSAVMWGMGFSIKNEMDRSNRIQLVNPHPPLGSTYCRSIFH